MQYVMFNDKRPVFLNVFQLSLPVTALVSILHRISGVVLILSLPILMYIYYDALRTQEGFAIWQNCLGSWLGQFFSWGVFSAFFYHLFAGVRHIWHDVTGNHHLLAVQKSALITLVAWFLFVIALTYRIFFGA